MFYMLHLLNRGLRVVERAKLFGEGGERGEGFNQKDW